jgi:hypothetical protein
LMFGRTIGSFACESFHHPCYVFWNYNGQCGGICEATNWSLYEIYLKLWFEKEQIGKSGISVPWLIAASPANNSHPCSKLSCILVQWAYLVMINVTTSPSITNLTIKFSHNKAHSCAHTHTNKRETCCKNGKLDINHKYKLTLTDPQTWHEVYPYHGNTRLCFLQQISTSKRSHILLQRSTVQTIQWAADQPQMTRS